MSQHPIEPLDTYRCMVCNFESKFADLVLGHLLLTHEAVLKAALYGKLIDILKPAKQSNGDVSQ